MLGDSVQGLCLPCAYTPLLVFPAVSPVLLFPVYAQESCAAALLKAQGSLLRARDCSQAVLCEAGHILICGGLHPFTCCQCEGEGGIFAVPERGTSREEGVERMSVVARIRLFLEVGGNLDTDGHRMG